MRQIYANVGFLGALVNQLVGELVVLDAESKCINANSSIVPAPNGAAVSLLVAERQRRCVRHIIYATHLEETRANMGLLLEHISPRLCAMILHASCVGIPQKNGRTGFME